MKLKDLTKEELKTLSYTDLTNLVLSDSKKPMTTPVIFKKICELLDYSDSDDENKIGIFMRKKCINIKKTIDTASVWSIMQKWLSIVHHP